MDANRNDNAAASPAFKSVAGQDPPAGTGTMARQRFVVGVFTGPLEAGRAIATLTAGGAEHCALVLVSDRQDGLGSILGLAPSTSVPVHNIDCSTPLPPQLAEILARDPDHCAGAGMQRFIQRLAQCLSDRSACVVCSTRAADQQRVVSQALLGARCKVVLTHEDERGACRSRCDQADS